MRTTLLGIGLVVAVVAGGAAVLAWTEERRDAHDLRETADGRATRIDELEDELESLRLQSESDQGATADVVEQASLAADACEEAASETLNFLEAALGAGAAVDARHVDLADTAALACRDVRVAVGNIPGG